MNLASLQQDLPQVGYALLCKQHLIVGLDHPNSSSTIPLSESFWESAMARGELALLLGVVLCC